MAEILPAIDNISSCIDQVAAGRTDTDVQENLDCATDAELVLAECLGGSDCSEEQYNSCFDEYHLDYADCLETTDSASVTSELNACF